MGEIFNIAWVALGERMGAEEEKLPRWVFILSREREGERNGMHVRTRPTVCAAF